MTNPARAIRPVDSAQVLPAPAINPQKSEPAKIKLQKRTYHAGRQVALAIFMMIFAIGTITLAQQWNPR